MNSVHEIHPNAHIETLALDLSSFDSIKRCAAEFRQGGQRLDLLFLNAGVAATSPCLTRDGYESQFGINHIGHVLLTQLLLPIMLQTVSTDGDAANVRIMVTSSDASETQSPRQGLVLSEMKTADALGSFTFARYGHSKLANALFARKLAQVFPSITSTSFHPGVVQTGIWSKINGASGISWLLMAILKPIVRLIGLTPEKGAETGLWCATAEDVENGAYYVPVGKLKKGSKHVTDQKADELWEWTNKELAEHGSPGWPGA